jgi:hypothetical protein
VKQPCIPGKSHAWLIDSPDGRRMLPGTCRICKETREFQATNNDGLRDSDGRTVWRSNGPRPKKETA